jgi:hypothetical protein
MEGDDAEEGGGDTDPGDYDEPAGTLAPSASADVPLRYDLEVRPFAGRRRGVGTGGANRARGSETGRHQAAS